MELDFPIKRFLQIKQELATARLAMDNAKARWQAVRDTLTEAEQQALDEEFDDTFIKMGDNPLNIPVAELRAAYEALHTLVQRGASARLQGDYELGSHNLAMFINQLGHITDKDCMPLAVEIVRITIIAGASLSTQKAYAGNGGAICMDWVCWYIGNGLTTDYYLKTREQYDCYCQFFILLMTGQPVEDINKRYNQFNNYLICLRRSPSLTEWQEKVILAMIAYGFSPFAEENYYSVSRILGLVGYVSVSWLGWLFPYEHNELIPYIRSMQASLTKEAASDVLYTFTNNHDSRKFFKAFFSPRAHWLLQYIITTTPDSMFHLVKGNERDVLAPFLKHYRTAMLALRDEHGNTLLHQAALSKIRSEATIQLLRSAGFSLDAKNKEGLTPLALAVKLNRKSSIACLKG